MAKKNETAEQTLSVRDIIVTALKKTERPGIDDLIDYMDEIGFFTAPASGGNHSIKEGGLAEHSLNVMRMIEKFGVAALSGEGYNAIQDSAVISALLHDLGKCGDYGKKLYVPNMIKDGRPTKAEPEQKYKQSEAKPWKRNPDLLPIDHSTRSIKLATLFIDLTEDEEFVHDVAELAIDTQITIGIYDNMSVTTEKTVKTYDQETQREDFTGSGSGENPIKVTSREEDMREEAETTTTQSNTSIDIEYAKTWLAIYEKKFTYTENENEIPRDWESEATWTSLSNEIISEEEVHEHEIRYLNKTVNVNVKTANISTTSTYSYVCTNGSGEITELTDIEEYKRENFVAYLRKSETALKYLTDSPEWMYEILSSSEKTSNMVDVFKYLLYKATGNDYGVTDISSFLNSISTMFGNFLSLGNDFIVHTDMMPEIVLDRETILATIGKKYNGARKENLESVIDELITIQEEDKVNAIFAIAVAVIESGGGTAWAAIDSSTHNWMSVSFWRGSNATTTYKNGDYTWCSYASFNQATLDFGKYITNYSDYFPKGNYSVKTIAPTYHVAAWGESIVAEMRSFLSEAGVNVDSVLSQYNSTGVSNGTGWWFPVTSSASGYDITGIYTTQKYGNNGHGGEDIVGGERIIATRSGTVSLVQHWNGIVTEGDMNSYGNLVIIDHGDGYKSFYAHLSTISVTQGQQVTQGQDIGIMGNTGNSTGTHLHFEIQYIGKRQNPMSFVSYSNPYPVEVSNNTTINFNKNDYVILSNANDFAQYTKQKGYYQGANEAWGDHCLGFSQVYCEAIKTGNFDIVLQNKGTGNSPILKYSSFTAISNNKKEEVLKRVYEEINKGNPCLLQVNGNPSGTSRHYVAVVGYKKSVTSESNIKETDLLIIDVWDGNIETLNGKNSGTRFMTKGTETGYKYGYQIYVM